MVVILVDEEIVICRQKDICIFWMGKKMILLLYIFEIENGAGRFKKVQLKGNINEIYRTDWYDSQCLIRYIPKGEINSGNIQLEYLLR